MYGHTVPIYIVIWRVHVVSTAKYCQLQQVAGEGFHTVALYEPIPDAGCHLRVADVFTVYLTHQSVPARPVVDTDTISIYIC